MLYQLLLGGGTGGTAGTTTYTAPNGVILRSSAPVYSNSNLYYMSYLFDGSTSSANATTYWLTESSSTVTLTADFGTILDKMNSMNTINVYPRTRDDSISSYSISGSNDGTSWTPLISTVTNTYANCPYGTKRTHTIGAKYRYIRFTLTQSGSFGVTLNEIEFLADMIEGYSDVRVGKPYPLTETGWTRYEDTESAFDYYPLGGWQRDSNAVYSGGTALRSLATATGNTIRFSFIGTAFRLIITSAASFSNNLTLNIDGALETLSAVTPTTTYKLLGYEKRNLSNKRHFITITTPAGSAVSEHFRLDAIELLTGSRFMHVLEVATPGELEIGNRIRCHYRGNQGAVGVFSGLGENTSPMLPVTPTSTPNGDFYFIAVDKDRYGKVTLLADRNIQGGVSATTLNIEGLVEGVTQGERVYPLVPTLTSATSSTDVEVTTNGDYGAAWAGWMVFDARVGTEQNSRWVAPNSSAGNAILQVKFSTPQTIVRYSILTSLVPSSAPKGWYLEGSNDGVSWTVLDTRSGISSLATNTYFKVSVPGLYQYVRIRVDEAGGYASYFTSIDEMQFFAVDTFPMTRMSLPSGGVAATTKDNDWDNYIVKSTLAGTRTFNDFYWWNVGNVWSHTTDVLAGNYVRVVRGSGNGTARSTVTWTDTVVTNTGFRPKLELFTGGSAEIDLVSKIEIKTRADFPSSLNVYSDNGDNFSQRKSSLYVANQAIMASQLFVAPHAKMLVQSAISPVYKDDKGSMLDIKIPNNLISYISVAPVVRMLVSSDIKPQPVVKTVLNPIKDAFVRANVPRLNYGAEQEMLVGTTADGDKFKSLIQFDVDSLPEKLKIKTAKLRLYVEQSNLSNTPIVISDILQEWTEYGVTWASAPTIGGKLYELNADVQKSYVELDILSLVQEWYGGARVNQGIMLTLDKIQNDLYARLGTRERGSAYAPQLVIEYVDTQVPSYSYADVGTFITARQNKPSNLGTTLTVRSTWDKSDLASGLHVHNQDMIESSISVSRGSMYSTIQVRRVDNTQLGSSITVQNQRENSIDSSVRVSLPGILGDLTVRNGAVTQVGSTLIVNRKDASNLSVELSVSRPFMQAAIDVFAKSLLGSTITVKDLSNVNLPSKISVQRNDFSGLASNIDVMAYLALPTDITVKSGYLHSSITVPYHVSSDLASHIRVSERYASDLVTSILVELDDGSYAFIM